MYFTVIFLLSTKLFICIVKEILGMMHASCFRACTSIACYVLRGAEKEGVTITISIYNTKYNAIFSFFFSS